MQFSIQRPTLPSAETHPEEKLYRRLDVTTWLRHLNHSGQVEEEYKLRKVCMCSHAYFFSLRSTQASPASVQTVKHFFDFPSDSHKLKVISKLIPSVFNFQF